MSHRIKQVIQNPSWPCNGNSTLFEKTPDNVLQPFIRKLERHTPGMHTYHVALWPTVLRHHVEFSMAANWFWGLSLNIFPSVCCSSLFLDTSTTGSCCSPYESLMHEQWCLISNSTGQELGLYLLHKDNTLRGLYCRKFNPLLFAGLSLLRAEAKTKLHPWKDYRL